MTRIAFLLVLWSIAPKAEAQTAILSQGHSHNDYWRDRPLLDALDHGFMSVEADVHLVNGRMLVAHERALATNRRNLEDMYLWPLLERAKANSFSSVYPGGPPGFVLYIDIKGGCPAISDTLISLLRRYEPMLTVWDRGEKVRDGAVTVIVGACGREEEWLSAPRRWFCFDGRPGDIGGAHGPAVIPRVSASLRSVTGWNGRGAIPQGALARLREFVQRAHSDGRQVRLWAATNRPAVWQLLLGEGVDIINVDKLQRFREFMRRRAVAKGPG